MPTFIDPSGGPIRASLVILSAQIGTYAVDIWDDSDGSGTPSRGDKFERRAKDFGQELDSVVLGAAASLRNKTVRFIWGATALGGGDTKSRVRVELSQDQKSLPGFPKTIEADFRAGQNHDVFSVFYFLQAK